MWAFGLMVDFPLQTNNRCTVSEQPVKSQNLPMTTWDFVQEILVPPLISICKTRERLRMRFSDRGFSLQAQVFVSTFISVFYVCICVCICICTFICKTQGLVYGGRHLWFSDRGVSLRAAESNLSRDAQIQFIFILCQPPPPPSSYDL